MKIITIELDNQTFEKVSQLAETQQRSLEALLLDMIRQLAEEPSPDPILGLFADDPTILDEVVSSAMTARENHSLRADDE